MNGKINDKQKSDDRMIEEQTSEDRHLTKINSWRTAWRSLLTKFFADENFLLFSRTYTNTKRRSRPELAVVFPKPHICFRSQQTARGRPQILCANNGMATGRTRAKKYRGPCHEVYGHFAQWSSSSYWSCVTFLSYTAARSLISMKCWSIESSPIKRHCGSATLRKVREYGERGQVPRTLRHQWNEK